MTATDADRILTAIRAVHAGDREAFREVVRLAETEVRAVVAAVLQPWNPHVDDVVQETFLLAWRKLHVIDSGSPLAWFATIARNLARNERRRFARRQGGSVSTEALLDRVQPTALAAISADVQAALEICLGALSDQARAVIAAHYWQSTPAEEIAHEHERTPGWVRVVLCRARAALALCLRHRGVIHESQ